MSVREVKRTPRVLILFLVAFGLIVAASLVFHALTVQSILVSAFFGGGESTELVDSEEPLIEGTWEVVAVRHDGKEEPENSAIGWLRWRLGSGYLDVLCRPDHENGLLAITGLHRYDIDSSTNPKRFAVHGFAADLRGTYRLAGDRLVVCLSDVDEYERWDVLDTIPGGKRVVVEFVRVSKDSSAGPLRGRRVPRHLRWLENHIDFEAAKAMSK